MTNPTREHHGIGSGGYDGYGSGNGECFGEWDNGSAHSDFSVGHRNGYCPMDDEIPAQFRKGRKQ